MLIKIATYDVDSEARFASKFAEFKACVNVLRKCFFGSGVESDSLLSVLVEEIDSSKVLLHNVAWSAPSEMHVDDYKFVILSGGYFLELLRRFNLKNNLLLWLGWH